MISILPASHNQKRDSEKQIIKNEKKFNHIIDLETNKQYDGLRYILMTKLEIQIQHNETKLVETSFLNTSPIQIQKFIDAKLSKLENVKKLRNGKRNFSY